MSVCYVAKLMDEIVMSAFSNQCQFEVATRGTNSECVFLWQVAMNVPVDPAAAVTAAMHRSAVHNGNSIIVIMFVHYYRVVYTWYSAVCC